MCFAHVRRGKSEMCCLSVERKVARSAVSWRRLFHSLMLPEPWQKGTLAPLTSKVTPYWPESLQGISPKKNQHTAPIALKALMTLVCWQAVTLHRKMPVISWGQLSLVASGRIFFNDYYFFRCFIKGGGGGLDRSLHWNYHALCRWGGTGGEKGTMTGLASPLKEAWALFCQCIWVALHSSGGAK